VLDASDGILGRSGYAKAEVVGSKFSDYILDGEGSPALRRALARLETEIPTSLNLALRSKDGRAHSSVVFMLRASADGGSDRRIIGFVRTARPREVDDRIRIAAAALHRVIERISDPIIMISAATRAVLDCNGSFESFLGWERGELIGQTTQRLHENDRRYVEFGTSVAARSSGSDVFLGTWRWRHRDGGLVACTVVRLDAFCRYDEPATIYVFSSQKRAEEEALALARAAKENMILAQKLLSALCPPPETTDRGPGSAKLSQRQIEVAELVAQGLSSKEVAARLGLSEATVRNHLSILFRKLGVSSRIALANALRAKGMLSD